MNKEMTEWWKTHFDLFFYGSPLMGIAVIFFAWIRQRKNNTIKNDESLRNQKYPSWYVEIIPFILGCFASIVLFNWLIVFFEIKHISVPSPLSYENAFLLVLPLAWTVGIAFFQYRIQDRLTRSQQEEEKLQRQHRRRGEMISALSSLYSCSFSAINFNTRAVAPSIQRPFLLSIPNNNCFDSGFAFAIINKSGDPCFYFPYYKISENMSSSCITLKIEGNTIKENMYSITPNEAYIWLPSNISTAISYSSCNPNFEKTIRDFFVSPVLKGAFSQQNGLEFEIIINMEDSFYIDKGKTGKLSGCTVKYSVHFTLNSCDGYSSEGCFPLKITKHSIEL